jgi:hypothetical protein
MTPLDIAREEIYQTVTNILMEHKNNKLPGKTYHWWFYPRYQERHPIRGQGTRKNI